MLTGVYPDANIQIHTELPIPAHSNGKVLDADRES